MNNYCLKNQIVLSSTLLYNSEKKYVQGILLILRRPFFQRLSRWLNQILIMNY